MTSATRVVLSCACRDSKFEIVLMLNVNELNCLSRISHLIVLSDCRMLFLKSTNAPINFNGQNNMLKNGILLQFVTPVGIENYM